MVNYPIDWTEKMFNVFMKIKRGASPRPIENFITSSMDGVNWIKIGDAPRYGKNIVSTKEKITPHGAAHSVRVYPGDFLLSNSMSFGRPYILSVEGCIHDGWLRLYEFQSEANDEFLYYLLSSSYVQKQYEAFAAGSGVQNLNKEVVKKVSVFLPSIPEQEKIAETLSNFDSYIDDLAELIEKKKGIRDGALEDLTSGITRVSGYNECFIEKEVGDISSIQDGTHGTYKRTEAGFYLLSAKNVFNNHLILSDDESKVSEIDYLQINSNGYPQRGDILLSCVGTIGRCCILDKDNVAFQRSVAFVRTKDVNNQYLLFVLQSNDVQNQLLSMINASAQGGIYLGSLKKIKIKITLDINEQKAIASILTAMDEEIEALEIEREKMIQIRDGAMDDLLTGRVRLTV